MCTPHLQTTLFNFSNFTCCCPFVIFVAFVPQNQAMWTVCNLANVWVNDVWTKATCNFFSFFSVGIFVPTEIFIKFNHENYVMSCKYSQSPSGRRPSFIAWPFTKVRNVTSGTWNRRCDSGQWFRSHRALVIGSSAVFTIMYWANKFSSVADSMNLQLFSYWLFIDQVVHNNCTTVDENSLWMWKSGMWTPSSY